MILLDTFQLTKVKEQIANAISTIQKERDAAKKKADKEKAKKSNETSDGDDKKEDKEEKEDPDTPQEAIKAPKLKISVEFTRSGVLSVTKATVGSHFVDVEQVRKPTQLTADHMRQAKARLNWYTQRDSDKQKTDMARNEFEAMIYKFKDWLRDDDNSPYCVDEVREAHLEKLTELEDWLYEDGASANYTTYDKERKNLSDLFDSLNNRKVQHAERETVAATAEKGLEAYEAKLDDLKTTKTWITDEERQDVTDKIGEIRNWLKEQLDAQAELKLSEDPVFQTADLMKKMAQLKKLFTKVSSKKKPKPPKEDKVEEEKEEEKQSEEDKSSEDEQKEDL